MNRTLMAILMLCGIVAVAYGLIRGVHETAWVGIAMILLSILDGVLLGLFDRLDLFLNWKSCGYIKPKRK